MDKTFLIILKILLYMQKSPADEPKHSVFYAKCADTVIPKKNV